MADLVAEQHDALVERFIERARAAPEADGLDRVELIDSMSFFLDDLVAALAADVPINARDSAASSHGVERLALGFRIDRVVREYALVARVILDSAAEHGVAPTPGELDLLFSSIGDGAAIAAREYVRRRDEDVSAREAAQAGFLAHEVRNSLASARFAFDLLRRRVPDDAAPLAQLVDGSLRQAMQRIDDALVGARLRGGVVSRVPVQVGLLLEEIERELRLQAREKQLTVETDTDRDIVMRGDPRLIRSALTNLLQNAVKFSRPGGTVTARVRHEAGLVTITVDDACGGIAADKLDRIFAPFVQGGGDGSGFGLGLAIAREAAQAHGGSLVVENVAERGCRFTLTLPLGP